MPELPEVELYLAALRPRVVGQVLEKLRIRSVSLLRTWEPKPAEAEGREVLEVRRLGKRIVFGLEGDLFLVVHLMISGRFQWRKPGAAIPKKGAHAAFDFPDGTLLLTEAGTQKRATLHIVRGEEALAELDPGGLEPLRASLDQFGEALRRENRTLKRALTDPRIFSGIGNAHSDEILLEARLSPLKRTGQLAEAEIEALYAATTKTLTEWTERLQAEAGDRFPTRVTAFHPAMKAHGKFGEPCANCGTRIQRIVRGSHETNYCPNCQTGGKVLKDRALSKLLGDDWPRTMDEMEELERS